MKCWKKIPIKSKKQSHYFLAFVSKRANERKIKKQTNWNFTHREREKRIVQPISHQNKERKLIFIHSTSIEQTIKRFINNNLILIGIKCRPTTCIFIVVYRNDRPKIITHFNSMSKTQTIPFDDNEINCKSIVLMLHTLLLCVSLTKAHQECTQY